MNRTVFRILCDDCGEIFRNDEYRDVCDACRDPPDEADERTYKGYKDRYTSYYGTDWRTIRDRVLDRDDHACRNCGMTDDEHRERDDLFGGGLHIHHKTPAKDFNDRDEANDLSNLIALCAECHRDVENGVDSA